jgi:hypothetical protein
MPVIILLLITLVIIVHALEEYMGTIVFLIGAFIEIGFVVWVAVTLYRWRRGILNAGLSIVSGCTAVVVGVMRAYYYLTPHPAKEIVSEAIAGEKLDGKVFAEIMRPVPGGEIEKAVRTEQALRLAEKARRYSASVRAEADRVLAKAALDKEIARAENELKRTESVRAAAQARLAGLRKRAG